MKNWIRKKNANTTRLNRRTCVDKDEIKDDPINVYNIKIMQSRNLSILMRIDFSTLDGELLTFRKYDKVIGEIEKA